MRYKVLLCVEGQIAHNTLLSEKGKCDLDVVTFKRLTLVILKICEIRSRQVAVSQEKVNHLFLCCTTASLELQLNALHALLMHYNPFQSEKNSQQDDIFCLPVCISRSGGELRDEKQRS